MHIFKTVIQALGHRGMRVVIRVLNPVSRNT
jgi:hypothetical protein